MRLNGLGRFFSYSRYKKLRQDFRAPLHALYAASGISSTTISLLTNANDVMQVNRDDLSVWEAYFKSDCCEVHIEQGMFQIIPLNSDCPKYFIKGCNGGLTWNPGRWNNGSENNSFITWLQAQEKSIWSQHGEDGVLEALMEKIPAPVNYIVEFGAYDGVCMSNSRYLIERKGWSGFLIEADPRFYKKLDLLYKNHPAVTILKSFVTTENFNSLLTNANVPKDFDILSIDIDSIDYYVWEALTDYKPKIVIIECNASIMPDQEYVVPKGKALDYSGTSREGASIMSLYKLGKSKGYRLMYAELSGANLFFVSEDVIGNFPSDGVKPADIYQPPQFGAVCGGVAPNGRGYI